MANSATSTYKTAVTASDFHPESRTFYHNKKVLVAGGSGFIGSHAVEQLISLSAKVSVVSRQKNPDFLHNSLQHIQLIHGDFENAHFANECIAGQDVVVNFAASVGGIEYNAKHPASIFQANLQTFFNIIAASQKNKVERFVVVSSACVYPRHCSIPTMEDEGVVGEPEPTNSGYGWAKRMEEYLGKKYAEEFGLSVAIPRPYNAYGPRDNFEPKSSHVIPALIVKAFQCNGVFEVWGDGTHSRSFLYVDDFARGCLEVGARYPQADPVNIGADEEISIRDLAFLIAKYVGEIRGMKLEPKFNPQGITGQPRRKCSTQKAEATVGYKTKVSFEEGLKKMIYWYQDTRKG